MRLLLDENLPHGLKYSLGPHHVQTVAELGWAGIADADLLHRASREFDALITANRSLEFQQNLSRYDLIVVILIVPNTRLQTVTELAPGILMALSGAQPGQPLKVSRD